MNEFPPPHSRTQSIETSTNITQVSKNLGGRDPYLYGIDNSLRSEVGNP
jgi:hypothetical protein